jgi:hypothetical protein
MFKDITPLLKDPKAFRSAINKMGRPDISGRPFLLIIIFINIMIK